MNYFVCDQDALTQTHFDDRACSLEAGMIGMGAQRNYD